MQRAGAHIPRRLVLLLVAALLILAGVLGVRAYQAWETLQAPPTHQLSTDPGRIRPWMTIRYAAHENHVSARQLADRLGASDSEDITLGDLADRNHVPVRKEIADARAAIADLRGTSVPSPQPDRNGGS